MKVYYIRHGKSAKVQPPASDLKRSLNEEGQQQAERRGAKLGSIHFNLVLSSPAIRAVETAGIIGAGPAVSALPQLYIPDNEDGKFLDALFERLGYATLREYEENGAAAPLQRSALATIRAIQMCLMMVARRENILVVGHAILLNAIGVCLQGRTGKEALHDFLMKECEGFLDDGEKITLIQD